MNIDVKKWNPTNWFRNEEDQDGRSVSMRRDPKGAGLPSLYADSPLWGLHREMDRLFEGVFERFNTLLPDVAGGTMLKPSVDIKESGKAYKVTVEVPGVDEKDVKLELCDGVLTISGEKKHEKEDGDENWHRLERSYGSFQRVLTLPDDVDQEAIEAKFKNGVLTITVPRKQIEKPKEISKAIEIKRAA